MAIFSCRCCQEQFFIGNQGLNDEEFNARIAKLEDESIAAEIPFPLCENCSNDFINAIEEQRKMVQIDTDIMKIRKDELNEQIKEFNLNNDMNKLLEEEKEQKEILSNIENELSEIQNMKNEVMKAEEILDYIEKRGWKMRDEHLMEMETNLNEIGRLESHILKSHNHIEALKNANPICDAFFILPNQLTINGLKLSSAPSNKQIANSALGQCALLMHLLLKRFNITVVRLVPLGTYSYIEKDEILEEDNQKSNQQQQHTSSFGHNTSSTAQLANNQSNHKEQTKSSSNIPRSSPKQGLFQTSPPQTHIPIPPPSTNTETNTNNQLNINNNKQNNIHVGSPSKTQTPSLGSSNHSSLKLSRSYSQPLIQSSSIINDSYESKQEKVNKALNINSNISSQNENEKLINEQNKHKSVDMSNKQHLPPDQILFHSNSKSKNLSKSQEEINQFSQFHTQKEIQSQYQEELEDNQDNVQKNHSLNQSQFQNQFHFQSQPQTSIKTLQTQIINNSIQNQNIQTQPYSHRTIAYPLFLQEESNQQDQQLLDKGLEIFIEGMHELTESLKNNGYRKPVEFFQAAELHDQEGVKTKPLWIKIEHWGSDFLFWLNHLKEWAGKNSGSL